MRYKSDEVLEYFLQEIRKGLGKHLKEVILFGSRARGDDVPGSDYDFLVVLDEVSPEIKDLIDEIAGEVLFQYSTLFSIFPVSEEEYNQKTFHPFLTNIDKEGIAL